MGLRRKKRKGNRVKTVARQRSTAGRSQRGCPRPHRRYWKMGMGMGIDFIERGWIYSFVRASETDVHTQSSLEKGRQRDVSSFCFTRRDMTCHDTTCSFLLNTIDGGIYMIRKNRLVCEPTNIQTLDLTRIGFNRILMDG